MLLLKQRQEQVRERWRCKGRRSGVNKNTAHSCDTEQVKARHFRVSDEVSITSE